MQRRFGLKARFTALIAALLTTIFVVVAIIVLQTNVGALRADLLERSKAFAALATTPIGSTFLTYQDSGTTLINKKINSFIQLDRNIDGVAVVDLNGKVVYSNGESSTPVLPAEAKSFEPIYNYGSHGAIRRIVYPFIEDGGRHSYAVVYDISSSSIDAEVAKLVRSIIIFSVIGLLVSALVTYILINRLFLRPIQAMSTQAMIIAKGYYSEKIEDSRTDEIGDLAKSVNLMADSLKTDLRKLKEVDEIKSEFMMIASHNLRTPLTIINGYLELVRFQALSDELSSLIGSIEANSQRLGMFAEDMLMISNIDAGQNIFRMEKMPVAGLLDTFVSELNVLARDKQVTFVADIHPTDAVVNGSKLHLRSAIWNILDNALKFTEANGKVELHVRHVDDNLQIKIKDSGAGISPEELPKLFTKFHRGTSTETYNYEGTGIGLYIAKLIIDAHHGTIEVTSKLGKGTVFTITVPTIVSDENVTVQLEKPSSTT